MREIESAVSHAGHRCIRPDVLLQSMDGGGKEYDCASCIEMLCGSILGRILAHFNVVRFCLYVERYHAHNGTGGR
jgi:hypothetical protein